MDKEETATALVMLLGREVAEDVMRISEFYCISEKVFLKNAVIDQLMTMDKFMA